MLGKTGDNNLLEKGERRTTEDEMAGWHHRFNGHEFEQTLGDSGGQGSLACFPIGASGKEPAPQHR